MKKFILMIVLMVAVSCHIRAAAPDFAFPKSVCEDAEKNMRQASSKGDMPLLVQSATAMVIASDMIDGANAGRMACMLDSVAKLADEPYRQMLYSLEAQLYSEIYCGNSVEADRRGYDPAQEDVLLWSRQMYLNRVMQLVSQSMDNPQLLMQSRCDDFRSLLTENGNEFYPSLYEVLGYRAAQFTQCFSSSEKRFIPFGTDKYVRSQGTPSEEFFLLIIETLKGATASRDALAMAYCQYANIYLQGKERVDYLLRMYDSLKDYPCSTEILSNLCGHDGLPANFREMCEAQIARYPDYSRLATIKNYLALQNQPQVSFSYPSRVAADASPVVKVERKGVWPDREVYALVYKLPADYTAGADLFGKEGCVYRSKLVSDILLSEWQGDSCSINLPLLEAGYYFVAVSAPGSRKLSPLVKSIDVLQATNAMMYYGGAPGDTGSHNMLWLTDARNGKPLQGVKITATGARKSGHATLTTDVNGSISIPDTFTTPVEVSCHVRGEKIYHKIYMSRYGVGQADTTAKANVYTDLALYHPGDTLRFATILYRNDHDIQHVLANRKLKAVLLNASWQPVDTLSLTTDKFGRSNGSFLLPKDGLAGRYSVQISQDGRSLQSAYVRVENYSLPTFFISTDSMTHNYKLGDIVNVCGEVKTYSGMPVSGIEVKVNISFFPWMPWWRYGGHRETNATYQATATTDASGTFSLKLPTEGLKDSPYERGRFNVNVSATNAAGETQQVETCFSIGDSRHLQAIVPEIVEKGITADILLTVQDIEGKNIDADVSYRIEDSAGKTVLVGKTNTLHNVLRDKNAFLSLNSGVYKASFSLPGDTVSTVSSDFILWDHADSQPPVKTPLWVPQTEYEVPVGTKSVEVTAGSSYQDSYMLCVVSDTTGIVSSKFINVSNANCQVQVPAPTADSPVQVCFVAWRDAKTYVKTVTLTAKIPQPKTELKVLSFRDKIVSGTQQRWTYTLTTDDKAMTDVAGLVTISNKALQSITPFGWQRGFLRSYNMLPYRFSGSSLSSYWTNVAEYSLMKYKPLSTPIVDCPNLQLWGEALYQYQRLFEEMVMYDMVAVPTAVNGQLRVRGARKLYMSAANVDVEQIESAEEEKMNEKVADTDTGTYGAGEMQPASEKASVQLRDAVVPLAYFNPALVAKDGVLEVSFEAPDANTIWQMQLLGYTADLQQAMITQNILAQKPVMTQGNFPRFVRTADHLTLLATVYNNTEAVISPVCRMELFNPLTGREIKAEQTIVKDIQPLSSDVFGMTFDVPDDLQMIGVRIYSTAADYTDGEQQLISVLPASSLVIESISFYLQPSDDGAIVEIPAVPGAEGYTATLIYNDNPMLTCLTSLPAIRENRIGVSITSRLNSLFSNSVASDLMQKNPVVADSIRSWTENHSPLLVSQLKKNEQLKLKLLSQTPWVNNADAQTLRMVRLYTLLDKNYASTAIERDTKSLLDLQNQDGGFSWCPGMSSSLWVTQQVISTLARMQKLQAIPEGSQLINTAAKAISYMDKHVCQDFERNPKHYDYLGMLQYLYSRHILAEKQGTAEFERISAEAISRIAKDWRKLGLYDAATAAMLLQARGYGEQAHSILESLRQKATVKESCGMYYANLGSVRNYGELLTTSRVLQAYSEIEPQAADVDLLRQWVLLQSQTTEWGECPQSVEAVYALLNSGSDWTVPAATPTHLTLHTGKKSKQLTESAGLEEYQILTHDPTRVSVEIKRAAGHPAWGAVIQTYTAPNQAIKQQGMEDLSILKHIYIIEGDSLVPVANTNLKVGQRICVQLQVISKRDMQYVLIDDGLPACMQPVNQISGYRYEDGFYGYCEVGDNNICRYISYLPKGTHLFNYECFVTLEGSFSMPIATVQSQYAPSLSAHSQGDTLLVK